MTGNSIVADTNIFIDLMKGSEAIAKKLESFEEVYLSPVVECKLLSIDAATAEIFVTIKLALFAKGNPIPENDIWIAATSLQHRLPLYTNDKHFAEVEGIRLA